MSDRNIPNEDVAVYRDRMLRAARSVREAAPEDFTMAAFSRCGTPACVLGHYAARDDLQDAFEIHVEHDWIRRSDGSGIPFGYCDVYVLKHFGISHDEANELFSTEGCGGAVTPEAADIYIRKFIARKWPDSAASGFACFRAAALTALKDAQP